MLVRWSLLAVVVVLASWVIEVNPLAAQSVEKPRKKDRLRRVTYPIADLVEPIVDSSVFEERKPGKDAKIPTRDELAQKLTHLITSTVAKNTWESAGGTPPPHGATGLYHVAIRYPDRASLADALRRVLEAGIPLDGASDHGVSEALYLRDPDENGVELYRDRPEAEWPRGADGTLQMTLQRLDVEKLRAEAP